MTGYLALLDVLGFSALVGNDSGSTRIDAYFDALKRVTEPVEIPSVVFSDSAGESASKMARITRAGSTARRRDRVPTGTRNNSQSGIGEADFFAATIGSRGGQNQLPALRNLRGEQRTAARQRDSGCSARRRAPAAGARMKKYSFGSRLLIIPVPSPFFIDGGWRAHEEIFIWVATSDYSRPKSFFYRREK
jgi:hypothetical protein